MSCIVMTTLILLQMQDKPRQEMIKLYLSYHVSARADCHGQADHGALSRSMQQGNATLAGQGACAKISFTWNNRRQV